MRLPLLLSLPPALLALLTEGQQQKPMLIRKMGIDSSEKFFPDADMSFVSNTSSSSSNPNRKRDDDDFTLDLFAPLRARSLFDIADSELLSRNASARLDFRPPYLQHYDSEPLELRRGGGIWVRAAEVLGLLRNEKRAFACPTGYESCTDIGYPNSCCGTGETCYEIEDTGLGPVGCCPNGATCSGSLSGCGSGGSACPADLGGGCCIEGFVCQGVGCVASGVQVITVTRTFTTSSSTHTTTVTSTSSPTSTVPRSTSSRPSSTSTPSPTFPTTTASLTTASPSPPIRPTGTETDFCPLGYYACVASAGGGCCRTGQNCATTDCPPITYTTIVSDGATIAVPAPASSTTAGTCADGWFLCGDEWGAIPGCCPSGYGCGTASCTLSATTATLTVAKELPTTTGTNEAVGGRGSVPTAVVAVVGVVGGLVL